LSIANVSGKKHWQCSLFYFFVIYVLTSLKFFAFIFFGRRWGINVYITVVGSILRRTLIHIAMCKYPNRTAQFVENIAYENTDKKNFKHDVLF
jgi:hypothetical protein